MQLLSIDSKKKKMNEFQVPIASECSYNGCDIIDVIEEFFFYQ